VPHVIVYSELESTAGPDADTIEAAFRRVQTADNTAPAVARPLNLGRWVGPRPRVTRVMDLRRSVTRAAWLLDLPPWITPTNDEERRLVQRAENDRNERTIDQTWENLRRMTGEGGWVRPSLIPHDPRVHGPVSWWTTPEASTTRTRDGWDRNQIIGGGVNENPIGPNVVTGSDGRPLPTTPPPTQIPQVGEQAASAMRSLATIAVVGGVLYVAGPALRALFSGSGARREQQRYEAEARANAQARAAR
jgi:hypothetical protein